MELEVKRDKTTINFLEDRMSGQYKLYINDYLISVEGKPMTDKQLVDGLMVYAEKQGWRALVKDIRGFDGIARSILRNNLPDYLHPIIPEFMEQLLEACDDTVMYTANSIVGDFMAYAKYVGSLNPMTTQPARTPEQPVTYPPNPIGMEFMVSWLLQIDEQQLGIFTQALREHVANPKRTLIADGFSGDKAEELLNMMEDGKLFPAPMINGLCF